MSNKRICFFLVCSFFILFSVFWLIDKNKFIRVYPNPYSEITPNPVVDFEGKPDECLDDVQVPIPFKDRVPNRTGIQCVWSSAETLARYAECKKLYDITLNDNYKSYAGPASLKAMLEKYNVKYEMTVNKKDRSLLIKGCKIERRGVAFDIPGHVMVLVHYDEKEGIVKYINNSDKELKVRTWSMEEFNRRWDGWAFIIYADKDIVSKKYNKIPDIIIKDRNNNQGDYQKNYVFPPYKFDFNF